MHQGALNGGYPNRLTKPMVEEFLRVNLRLPPQVTLIKLPEEPTEWKHACVNTGVTRLNPREVACFGHRVIFSLCQLCGKVHYYFDTI